APQLTGQQPHVDEGGEPDDGVGRTDVLDRRAQRDVGEQQGHRSGRSPAMASRRRRRRTSTRLPRSSAAYSAAPSATTPASAIRNTRNIESSICGPSLENTVG